MPIEGPFSLTDLMADPYTPKLHDTVTVLDSKTFQPSKRFAGRWQVVKINPRTVRLKGLDNQPQPLVADPILLRKVEGDQGTTHTPAGSAVTVDLPEAAFAIASVVRVPALASKTGTDLFVVMLDEGGPTVRRLIALGGDQRRPGRYFRNYPRRAMTLVPPADITVK